MNQSKIKLVAILLALFVALGVSAWAISLYQDDGSAQKQASGTQTNDSALPGRTEITYLAQPGVTSLEQLQREAKDVVVLETEYGQLVDSIEGHKGGTDGKYWSFYVNGEMAQVGAGTYVQQEGDWVEWKFQKL